MKTTLTTLIILIVCQVYANSQLHPANVPAGDTVSSINYNGKDLFAWTSSDSIHGDIVDPFIDTSDPFPIFLGPIFGMSFFNMDNMFDYDNRALLSGNFPKVNGHSYHLGLLWGQLFVDPFYRYLKLTYSISYTKNNLSSSGNLTNPSMNNRLINYNGNTSDSLTTALKYNNKTMFSSISFDFMLSFIIIKNLSLNLEFSFPYIISDKIIETLEITDSKSQLAFKELENVQLKNDNRKLILIDNEIPNISLSHLPIYFGLFYELFLESYSFRFNYNIGTNLRSLQKDIKNDYIFHNLRLYWVFRL